MCCCGYCSYDARTATRRGRDASSRASVLALPSNPSAAAARAASCRGASGGTSRRPAHSASVATGASIGASSVSTGASADTGGWSVIDAGAVSATVAWGDDTGSGGCALMAGRTA